MIKKIVFFLKLCMHVYLCGSKFTRDIFTITLFLFLVIPFKNLNIWELLKSLFPKLTMGQHTECALMIKNKSKQGYYRKSWS